MKYPPIHYHDYLKVDQLLTAQNRRSEEFKNPVHDEMLFIITHQTYELWFKQFLFELTSILDLFGQSHVEEKEMGLIVARFNRMIQIQKLMIHQVDVLETMTPLDFLEFREYLYPASGFQSFQWRQVEMLLGLKQESRLQYNHTSVDQHLTESQKKMYQELSSKTSLFESIEKWLERTPFLKTKDFDFTSAYRKAVEEMFNQDTDTINQNPRLTPEGKQKNLEMMEVNKKTFASLWTEEDYKKLQESGYIRLSFKAFHAALLIYLYREQPLFQLPFQVLSSLLDLDENMTQWRNRHALMAHRMLGQKIGTGGSSGHGYLKAAADKHKIFSDFFNLSTFLIPRSKVPKLPKDLERKMNYSLS